jgi:hypothetical protein
VRRGIGSSPAAPGGIPLRVVGALVAARTGEVVAWVCGLIAPQRDIAGAWESIHNSLDCVLYLGPHHEAGLEHSGLEHV